MLSNKSPTSPDEGVDPNYEYLVNFVNDDNTFLWGSDDSTMTPSRYEGPMPAKTATDEWVYDFEPTNVAYWDMSQTSDNKTVYKARFTELSNNLNFEMNKDGESVSVVGFKNPNVNNEIVAVNSYYKGKKSNGRVLPIAEIGIEAFQNRETIESLLISDNVTIIGKSVFRGCKNLRLIAWSKKAKLKDLGRMSFMDSGLIKVILPDGLTVIPESTFAGCLSLVKIELPDELIYISKRAFVQTSITKIKIPKSVLTLDELSFANNKQLSSVQFQRGSMLKTIGDYSFEGSGLQEGISVPKGVIKIGIRAFFLTKLGEFMHIPSTVGHVGANAFDDLSGLLNLIVCGNFPSREKNVPRGWDEKWMGNYQENIQWDYPDDSMRPGY